MDDLKPCPLCEGGAVLESAKGPTGEFYEMVLCSQCGACSPCCDVRSMQDDEVHPVSAWNTRPAATALEAKDAEIARLKRLVADADDQFAFYAENHRAKGTVDGLEKAATNQLLAYLARALTGSQSHD